MRQDPSNVNWETILSLTVHNKTKIVSTPPRSSWLAKVSEKMSLTKALIYNLTPKRKTIKSIYSAPNVQKVRQRNNIARSHPPVERASTSSLIWRSASPSSPAPCLSWRIQYSKCSTLHLTRASHWARKSAKVPTTSPKRNRSTCN